MGTAFPSFSHLSPIFHPFCSHSFHTWRCRQRRSFLSPARPWRPRCEEMLSQLLHIAMTCDVSHVWVCRILYVLTSTCLVFVDVSCGRNGEPMGGGLSDDGLPPGHFSAGCKRWNQVGSMTPPSATTVKRAFHTKQKWNLKKTRGMRHTPQKASPFLSVRTSNNFMRCFFVSCCFCEPFSLHVAFPDSMISVARPFSS